MTTDSRTIWLAQEDCGIARFSETVNCHRQLIMMEVWIEGEKEMWMMSIKKVFFLTSLTLSFICSSVKHFHGTSEQVNMIFSYPWPSVFCA